MSAQTYTDPLSLERLRAGLCPECGGTVESHSASNAWWVPRGNDCSLRPDGVLDRVEWQCELDGGVVR